MKILSLVCLVLTIALLSVNSKAQNVISFVNSTNSEVIGVKVQLKNQEGQNLFQGISDNSGSIIIPINTISSSTPVRFSATAFGFLKIDTTLVLPHQLTIKLVENILLINEMVVTASYCETSRENAIHRIQVIDRKKIDRMGAVNLSDVLSNEMGVRLSQDNILGSSMSLQGISGENVKILLDGVPVVGRLNGNIDLSQINLQNIDHIEIVEGPLSVNYGTNALAGVIHLISKKPKHNQISASVQSYYESSGHYNLTGDFSYARKNSAVGISGGRQFFDGWHANHSTFKNPEPIADSSRYMTWKPKEQYFGRAFYQWKKSGWYIRLQSDYFQETVYNKGYPRAPYQETAFDDEYYTKRMDQAIQLHKTFAKKGKIETLSSYNRYNRIKNTYFTDLTTLNRQLTSNPSDQDSAIFDQWVFRGFYSSNKDSAKINYQIGYDVLSESAQGIRILDGYQLQSDFAVFATAEYRPSKKIIIRPGIRASYNTSYTSPILPSLNVKWSVSKKTSIRASYARGFRAPGIKELHYEFVDINHNIVGNTNLQAEESNNYLASFIQRFGGDKNSIETEISGFYNSIVNRISLASITGTEYTYVNIGEFKSIGGRAVLKWNKKNWNSTFGYGITGRASNLDTEQAIQKYLFSPEAQSSLTYSLFKSRTSFSVFYKFQGDLPNYFQNEDGNVYVGITNKYQMMDLTLSQKLWKNRISITVGIKNLFDVTQINSMASGGAHNAAGNTISVGTGRTYFTTFTFDLNKSFKKRIK
jgi:outer membrane receptor for ferrienterochelin and colicins